MKILDIPNRAVPKDSQGTPGPSRLRLTGTAERRRRRHILLAAAVVASALSALPAHGIAALLLQEATPAGSEGCASCHAEIAKTFAASRHSSLAQAHGSAGTCEQCHGAGKEHIAAGGDAGKIFNPSKASAKEADARCMACHEEHPAHFKNASHGEAGVGCTACHSIHGGEGNAHLLKASEAQVCYACHAEVKTQFSQPMHHKVEEGRIGCNDCHDLHGSRGSSGLKTAAQQDAACTRCHTKAAGPFTFEHGAVKAEGCTACHFAHGGPNAHLLNRANVNTICQSCHSPSPNSKAGVPVGPGHNQNQQTQACTACHSSIHGSNTNAHFLDAAEEGDQR